MENKECSNGDYKILIGGKYELDPCLYELVEEVHNCTVQILKCKKCGKIDIGWYREGAFDED
jgi:hypothetical protein